MTNFHDFLEEQLEDPQFKEEYEKLAPEFEKAQEIIDAEKIKNEYLSVKDFANRAGVSTQRIYQLLAKDLQSYCKEVAKVKFVHISALSRFNKQSGCNDFKGVASKDLQSLAKGLQDKIDELERQNTLLVEQLTVKDNQISALQDQVTALTDAMKNTTAALAAAQALHAGTMQELLSEKSDVQPDGEKSQSMKCGLWQRLFGRK